MRDRIRVSIFMAGYLSLCFLVGYAMLSTLNKPKLVVLDGALSPATGVGEK